MQIRFVAPSRFQVVWECIRPDVFVHEPGPEPPVVVRPITIHKDMQALIGSGQFSDIKFRFQVRHPVLRVRAQGRGRRL